MSNKRWASFTLLPALFSLIAQTQHSRADGAGFEYGNDCFNGVLGHQAYHKFIANDRSEVYRHQGSEYVKRYCSSAIRSRGFAVDD